MKQRLSILLLAFMAFFLVACQSGEPVSFSDEKLESIIREEIDKAEGDLFTSDFDEIIELDLSGQDIRSLDGIEALDQLEVLHLENNEIDDLSPLTDLDALSELYIPDSMDEEQQSIIDELVEAEVGIIWVATEIVGSPDGPGGFLWKVENGDTTVYLQGTIHVGKEELFPLNEKIENAYSEADIVVPEIDLNNLNFVEIQNITMELGTFQDDTTIKDHVSEELYEELDGFFEEQGIPLALMETYQPWMLSSTIQQLMLVELGYIEGVDEYFLARAEEDGKEVIALETVEEQFNVLAGGSMDFQVQMLEDSLVSVEEFDESMQELLDFYMDGDVDAMLEGLTEEDAEMSEEEKAYMEALNDNRNYHMAEKIAEFLEEDNGQTYFVIVGALHYILEPHIISILEEEGFDVEHVL